MEWIEEEGKLKEVCVQDPITTRGTMTDIPQTCKQLVNNTNHMTARFREMNTGTWTDNTAENYAYFCVFSKL